MTQSPNKLSRFWQELKRRNVVRVITVYAAAAFVILELVDIITEPFGLPDWTLKFIVVILAVGLIVAIILSWIYDIHPEGGIVKTDEAKEAKAGSLGKTEDVPQSSNSWKIASYISFVVIVALIVLNVIPRTKRVLEKEILDKSIAVLPFINDSPDEENVHIINGAMEAILDNLCKIEDLRVVGRTSVEQYRNNPKPIIEIGREMNVSYILEGSGQKYGNNVRLTFQLLDARNDMHLWSSPYSREIVMEEIFDLQSEIAQLVAAEIEAIITPEEKQRIEKVPTTNLTAYDLYRRGREEHNQYWLDNDNRISLDRAEELYHDALDYDSTFAQAYTGLAYVFWDKHYWESYFSESFLDSVLILADIALSFDPQLSEAYNVRGEYYREIGQTERAIEDFNKALKLNPNHWETYVFLGILYSTQTRYDLAIQNLYRASILHRGKSLPRIFKRIADALRRSGFKDQADAYYLEAFKLDHDTADYFLGLSEIEAWWINLPEAIKYAEKAFSIDSNNIEILSSLGNYYMYNGQYDQSLKYFEKNIKRLKAIGGLDIDDMQRIGFVYWQNGYKDEAEYYFNEQISYCTKVIELERSYSQSYYSYFDLAGVYAFKGNKEEAFENLRIFNQKERMELTDVLLFKTDPLLDRIRDEPEFQLIVRDVEAKYQAEHERVRKWLEENDIL